MSAICRSVCVLKEMKRTKLMCYQSECVATDNFKIMNPCLHRDKSEVCKTPSSDGNRMRCCVVWLKVSNVSEEPADAIFRVKVVKATVLCIRSCL
jgi:hypothetical protein